MNIIIYPNNEARAVSYYQGCNKGNENSSQSQTHSAGQGEEKMKSFTVNGFNLSTDYNMLWDLIFSGHRIPAWVLYREGNETDRLELWDLVEVKKAYIGEHRYSIGTRGIGYEGDQTRSDFLRTCEQYSLHFILPQSKGG